MRGIAARGVVAGLVGLLALTAPAFACNEPGLQVNPTSARAGDVVRYTVYNLTSGAQVPASASSASFSTRISRARRAGRTSGRYPRRSRTWRVPGRPAVRLDP